MVWLVSRFIASTSMSFRPEQSTGTQGLQARLSPLGSGPAALRAFTRNDS
jgi:hypothetical protein